MSAKRMQYKGASRDIAYNPWMRLVHGRHYIVDKHEMSSGKIRARVSDDDYETVRIMYKDKRDFEQEWC